MGLITISPKVHMEDRARAMNASHFLPLLMLSSMTDPSFSRRPLLEAGFYVWEATLAGGALPRSKYTDWYGLTPQRCVFRP